jgi:hypothetical protein
MGKRNECKYWCVCRLPVETQQPYTASWTTHDGTPDCRRRTLLQNFLRLCCNVQLGYVAVSFPSMRPTKDCLFWTKVRAINKVTGRSKHATPTDYTERKPITNEEHLTRHLTGQEGMTIMYKNYISNGGISWSQ